MTSPINEFHGACFLHLTYSISLSLLEQNRRVTEHCLKNNTIHDATRAERAQSVYSNEGK